jgi:pantetheine-phosphate adenylyltransferase
MAHINAVVGRIETVMLPASSQWSTLSSTMIREVASYGGDVSAFVPALVAERIRAKVTTSHRKEQPRG